MAVVPLLVLLLLTAAIQGSALRSAPGAADWRDAFGRASLVWGWIVFVLTEALSLFKSLTSGWLVACWLLLAVGALLIVGIRLRRDRGLRTSLARSLRPRAPGWHGEQFILAAVVALVLLSGVLALVAPTQEYDVVRYHLPRVAHWAQNHSVEHYATADSHQLWLPPWPEYAVLQTYLLGNGDRLANTVQWFSMLGTLILVSRIAGLLGASPKGQVLASAFAAAPPVLAQATTSAADMVPAYWAVCAAWLTLGRARGVAGTRTWVWIGLALGLGVVSKPAAVIYALPFVLWMGIIEIRETRSLGWVRSAALAALVVVVAGTPMSLRNLRSFGSPLGSPNVDLIENEAIDGTALVSNLVRNLSMQLATPFDRWNSGVQGAVEGLHRALGMDPLDPRTSFFAYRLEWFWPGDNSSPLQFALALAVGAALLVSGSGADRWPRRWVWLSAMAGLAAYGLVFRWQDSMRFQIPYLALMAPAVGAGLGDLRGKVLTTGIGLLLVLGSLPTVVSDRWRPMVPIRPFVSYPSIFQEPREDLFFRSSESLHAPIRTAAERIAEAACTDIGLRIDSHDREYLFWVVMDPLRQGLRIEHLLVHPGLEQYQDPAFRPCAVLCTVCDATWGESAGWVGEDVGGGLWVYLPSRPGEP